MKEAKENGGEQEEGRCKGIPGGDKKSKEVHRYKGVLVENKSGSSKAEDEVGGKNIGG